MRVMRRLLLSLLSVSALSACSMQIQTVTPEIQSKMTEDLKAGNLTLACTIECLFTWDRQVKTLHALDIAERWNDLYVKVMQIGYKQDLAYYYLGQSAQGLGYHAAAITYYRYANALATGQDITLRCDATADDALPDPCQGVEIASVVPVLIKASQDALDAQAVQQTPTPVKQAPPPRPKAPTLVKGGSYAVTAALNLRAGPSTQTDIVVKLSPGDAVVALGEAKNGFWSVTTAGGQSGWVSAQSLRAN
jgi:hypothetical protein